MKPYFSILATLLLFASASTLKAQIVNIPDPVFKGYLITSPVDVNGDFEIQVSEAQNFTGSIDLGGLQVTDLTGLEEFTNLTELDCFAAALTSLDISANTLLTKLYCGGNDLTSLDLSNNVNLTDLECSLLKITQLDLSNNVNLTALDFRGDSLLTTVNLKNGNNTAITNTNFQGESNPALTCVEVDNVVYSTGNWTNIDAASLFSANCFLSITETNNLPNLQAS
jgi:hypothetical protein